MVEVSSANTNTVASVSSERPSAARWRVPSDLSATLDCVRGSTHPAPMMRSPRTSTAPSCRGEYGVKIVVSRSAETLASIGTPEEMNSSRPMSPSTAMMAPVPARDSRSIASAISSATDWRSLCEKRRMKRDWPSRARAFRSSGWNTTTAANAPNVSGASWPRNKRAPRSHASAHATAVARSRSSTGRPVAAPRKRLRDGPTATGYPKPTTVASSSSRRKFCSGPFANPNPGSTTIRSCGTPASSAPAAAAASSAATSAATCRYPASPSIVSGGLRHRAVGGGEAAAVREGVGRHVHDTDQHGMVEGERAPRDLPAARRVGVARQETAQRGRQVLEPGRQPVGARQRGQPARGRAHERPALAGEHVGTGLRAPAHEGFPLGLGDVFEQDDEGLYTGGGKPGRLSIPAARRQRRTDGFGSVRGERGELHRTGLPCYDARSALTMLSRAARTAGRKPPTTPITTAKTRALVMTPGDSANPKPISEKLPKLRVETRAKDKSDASPTPAAPPAIASSTDSTRNAVSTLRRWNPRARSVPTSTTRLATAAYIVIIAPIIAPTLKMVVTTRPRILMNFAIACDCSR